MRHVILVMLVGLAACSSATSGKSTEELVAKDKVCATLQTQATCTADVADGCHWLPLPVNEIACAPGENCPVQQSGICAGETDGDQCVVADQCGRITDELGCVSNIDCEWVPGVCAEPANLPEQPPGSTIPPSPCPAFVCQPANPCDSLDVNNCNSNPSCMLQPQEECSGGTACPATNCPENQTNCAPSTCTTTPPVCTTSTVCVHVPVECVGSGSSADAGQPVSPPVNPGGGKTGSPPSSTNNGNPPSAGSAQPL